MPLERHKEAESGFHHVFIHYIVFLIQPHGDPKIFDKIFGVPLFLAPLSNPICCCPIKIAIALLLFPLVPSSVTRLALSKFIVNLEYATFFS